MKSVLRFMPTASGDLHLGHLGNLCLIKRFADYFRVKPYYIIDDIQVRGWGLYHKYYDKEEIDIYCQNIRKSIDFLFPNMFEYKGRFSDDIYNLERIAFMEEYKCRGLTKSIHFKKHDYCVPKYSVRKTINNVNLFDVLKSFYKECYAERYFHWNPFFAHEMIDRHFGTTHQIVDNYLYCPMSYLHDDHTNSLDLFEYWGNIVGRLKYHIHVHPRVVRSNGECLRKSESQDDSYSVFPLEDCWTRAIKAYDVPGENPIEEIGTKIDSFKTLTDELFRLKEI